jgi:hypothetical protein
MRKPALTVCLAVAIALPASSLAARATTAPGRDVIAYVRVTDTGIRIGMYGFAMESGTLNAFLVTAVVRGQRVTFRVTNFGKKPHDFEVLGRKTRLLRPGAKAHFTVSLLARGAFPYKSTSDKGKKALHGVFTVY